MAFFCCKILFDLILNPQLGKHPAVSCIFLGQKCCVGMNSETDFELTSSENKLELTERLEQQAEKEKKQLNPRP